MSGFCFSLRRATLLCLACLLPAACVSAPLGERVPIIVQLQNTGFTKLQHYPFTAAVVDPDDSNLTASQIQQLHQNQKLLIGYLSIGEAEDYRDYWQKEWSIGTPAWILTENPKWKGNFRVDYRNPDWQSITLKRAETFARLGYDGLYLDVVEAFETLAEHQNKAHSWAEQLAMVDFVQAIATRTRAVNPNFQLIPNGGVELLQHQAFLNIINGVFKEDTFYDEQGKITAPWTREDLNYLKRARNAGKYVIAIEYPTQWHNQQAAINAALSASFIPYIGSRKLNNIPAINRDFYQNYRLNAFSTDFDAILSLTGPILASHGEDSFSSGISPTGTPAINVNADVPALQATTPVATIRYPEENPRISLRERANRVHQRMQKKRYAIRQRIGALRGTTHPY